MRRHAVARIGRLGWAVLMLVGVALIVALYFVKTRASQARTHVKNLEHTLSQEEAGVRMLNAEIAHLENPERLRELSEQHLMLQPVDAKRTLTLEEAAQQLPKKQPPTSASEDGRAQ